MARYCPGSYKQLLSLYGKVPIERNAREWLLIGAWYPVGAKFAL